MSNRRSVFQNENPNPATLFLQWKSEQKKFAYYDKEKEANQFVDIPFSFLVLDILQTVKGYHKALDCGIYSNEIKNISEDSLNVKAFSNNTEIAKGLWSDIKADVDVVGGKYCQSIYAMTKGGKLINIALQGASLGEWFEFTKKSKSRLSDEWVTVGGYGEGKNGSVTYSFPTFEFSGSLDEDSSKVADGCFDVFEAYIKKYLKADEKSNEPSNHTDDEMEILANGEKEVNEDEGGQVYDTPDESVELADDLPF